MLFFRCTENKNENDKQVQFLAAQNSCLELWSRDGRGSYFFHGAGQGGEPPPPHSAGWSGEPPSPAGWGIHPCCGDTILNTKSLPIQDETIEERCWEGGALSADGGRKEPVAPVGDRQSSC